MTDREAILLWLYMAETWPNYPIPTDPDQRSVRLEVWADQLSDLDPRQIRAAIASLAGSDFPPPPGRIRDKALELARQAAGEREAPDPDEAWRAVRDLASNNMRPERLDAHDQTIIAHPAVAQTCHAIGWDEIRYSETPHFVRQAFLKAYATSADRYQREALLPAPAVAAFVAEHGAIKRADDVPELTP